VFSCACEEQGVNRWLKSWASRNVSGGTPSSAPTQASSKNNGEDVKVVQELLRHSSAKITLDVCAQALTPSKRAAQRKVVAILVAMIRENLSVPPSTPRTYGTSA